MLTHRPGTVNLIGVLRPTPYCREKYGCARRHRTVRTNVKITYLEAGNRRVYLAPADAVDVMADAAVARAGSSWLAMRDVNGDEVHWLLPLQGLLELHEYEVDEPVETHAPAELIAWEQLDYDF